MSHRRRAALATLAATVLVSLAACSSDHPETGPTTSLPATVSPTTTSAPGSTAPSTSATPPAGTAAPSTTAAPRGTPGGNGQRPPSPTVHLTPVLNTGGKDVGKAIDLATRPDDPALYVASQDGIVTRVVDGAPAGEVLDLTGSTGASGERGLLGLAFAPDGTKAYVYYTAKGGNVTVAEYAVGADGRFDRSTRRELLSIKHPNNNHNGGALRFGPDGLLYVGVGDGGAQGDPDRRALDTGDLLGKILRIDPTPSADGKQPYTVPADNPFVGVDGARPELWSIGLRNPWRINFDRGSGDLWIADVGQDTWEEIDVAWASEGTGRGASFGWSAREGAHPYNQDQSSPDAVDPVAEYRHGDDGCSISGGARYRGAANATLTGWYVYGDYCSGRIWALAVDDSGKAFDPVRIGAEDQVVTITEDAAGELYVLTLDGPVFRIDP
jgi:glucose/arabinose dehydrogenase